jgi:hypothetical protein
MKIRKAVWNFLIEGLTLLVLMAMVATGLMLEFRLPSGSGGGHGGVALAQLGLTRHEWGDIHFYLSLAFMALILIHLYLHWRWIWGLVKGSGKVNPQVRVWSFMIATAAFLIMAAIPWMLPITEVPGEREGGGGGGRNGQTQGQRQGQGEGGWRGGAGATVEHPEIGELPAMEGEMEEAASGGEFIRGRTTFGELAVLSGLTVEQVAQRLGLPDTPPEGERLGRTISQQGLTMSDVRRSLGLGEGEPDAGE